MCCHFISALHFSSQSMFALHANIISYSPPCKRDAHKIDALDQ